MFVLITQMKKGYLCDDMSHGDIFLCLQSRCGSSSIGIGGVSGLS